MTEVKLDRRSFLKAAGAAVAVAGGLQVSKISLGNGADHHPTGEHSWAMVIDLARCTGCDYCSLACAAHNDVPPSMTWNRLIQIEDGNGDEGPSFLPRPCMHCEDAPCTQVCPVGATYQRDDGIVMMNYDRCIGCRYCEIACPYFARAFNWEAFTGENPAVPTWGHPEVPRRPRGVVEKCTFCVQRIDRGLANGLTPGVDEAATPACVVACPVGARTFGDLNDPESAVRKLLDANPSFRLREDLGTAPRVYYLPKERQEVPAS